MPLGEHLSHDCLVIVLANSVCPLSQPGLVGDSRPHTKQVALHTTHLPDDLSLLRNLLSITIPPSRIEPLVENAALNEISRDIVELSILAAGLEVKEESAEGLDHEVSVMDLAQSHDSLLYLPSSE